MNIGFHKADTAYSLRKRKKLRAWIEACILTHGYRPGEISFIFTSNKHLLDINREYLNHNYFTDVITFDYSQADLIAGDVFISIDQVRINAREYRVTMDEELRRVMIHGVLHLMGFKDGSANEKARMRAGEEEALIQWKSLEE